MRNVWLLLSTIVSLFFQGICLAQSAPPEPCPPDSKKLDCIIFNGNKREKSDVGSGTVTGVQSGPTEKSLQRYVVFIHATKKDKELSDKVTQALREKTYNVKGADAQVSGGGAAVDYFREEDRAGAEAIALIVQGLRSDKEKIPVRLQQVSNPSGYIGVWLSAQGGSGWYYLGKLAKDKKSWTPDSSSNSSDLTFTPPLAPSAEIPAQIKAAIAGQATVASSKPKYLRASDAKRGDQVSADVEATLGPNVKVRILELDETGADDGYPVLWAKVEVLK